MEKVAVASDRDVAEPSAEERKIRIELAAVYRIFARMGLDDLIYTHISARLPGDEPRFLINPFGLMYEEVCASNLVEIDLDGNPVHADSYPVNHAGFVIHGAFHGGTEGADCVIHLHSDDGCAVAGRQDGLLPVGLPPLSWSTVNMSKTEDQRWRTSGISRKRLSRNCGRLRFSSVKVWRVSMRSERSVLSSRRTTAGGSCMAAWAGIR